MRKGQLLAPFLVLALAAAACGGDDNPPSAGGGDTTPPPTSTGSPLNNEGTTDATGMTKLTLEVDDFYFKPTFIKVTSGQALNIELENEGSADHTFTITALSIDEALTAGGKKEIDLTLPSGATDVAFFCRFHSANGMRGAFFFGATPSAGGESGDTNRY